VWKKFWEYLNIRKFMAMLVVGAYIAYIFLSGQDMGIKDVALIVISYFFGYANGQKIGHQEAK
jgi:hypothetical protein